MGCEKFTCSGIVALFFDFEALLSAADFGDGRGCLVGDGGGGRVLEGESRGVFDYRNAVGGNCLEMFRK
jgi:hypothetical protein